MPARSWSRLWRYFAAVVAGYAAWSAYAAILLLPQPLPPAQEEAVGAMLVLDALAGIGTLAALPLRRRFPLAVACVATLMSVVSVSSTGSAAVAVISASIRRRRGWAGLLASLAVLSGLVGEALYRPMFTGVAVTLPTATAAGAAVVELLFTGAAIVTGFYLGARRELFASLGQRLRDAEREQELRAQAARDAERTRIAHEMHDVLAHRISLIAMHSGALAYREDLSRAQTVTAAKTIQVNAQLAMAELREVLGVLRRSGDPAEPPQPSFPELPALLADVREAGAVVTYEANVPAADDMPQALSRTAFRIVQEALTNARRHAPGAAVAVRVSGRPGVGLDLEVRNPLTASHCQSTGTGLAGLSERARLTGGRLTHGPQPDGTFLVRAVLPWPA